MAHALTSLRLLLVAPVAVAFAQPGFVGPGLLFVLVCVAIATDYLDGQVARKAGTASARGQLFDHATDFIFVTTALVGAAMAGLLTPILPIVIIVAFAQYVLDSYFLYRQKQLRMSAIGRWNGILYFVPIVVLAVSRLGPFRDVEAFLTLTAGTMGYGLVASTVVSIVDRGVAPIHRRNL